MMKFILFSILLANITCIYSGPLDFKINGSQTTLHVITTEWAK